MNNITLIILITIAFFFFLSIQSTVKYVAEPVEEEVRYTID